MKDAPARIEALELPRDGRTIVISDIHGNLPYFEGLLKKLAFSDTDELIIDGDFLEKGQNSLALLRRIMRMSRRGNVHPLLGNCDGWGDLYRPAYVELPEGHILRYVRWKGCGLLWDMMAECGIDPFKETDMSALRPRLYSAFEAEWEFLMGLPNAIETDNFVFAHAGMRPDKPLREHIVCELDRYDRFMDMGYSFDRWLVVGHYPVVLYGRDTVCANPVIDRQRRIISIDGGCVLKDDGQLNALVIPGGDSESFSFEHYDSFPVKTVLDDQSEGPRSCYIRWGDNRVRVLRRGEEFSLCRHESSGYEMEILTKYLFTGDEITSCNDCTDYILPLKAGAQVSVVEVTSRGYFVKHEGVSGWYFGRLE